MVNELLSKSLKLPSQCWVKQKLPKTFFKRNFELTISEKKFLDEGNIIQQMEVTALVNVETSNISTFKDEYVTYEEIIFITVQTTHEQFDRQKNKIVDFIHKFIPNPTVVILHDVKQLLFSVAEKRINQNDNSKSVVEKTYISKSISFENQDNATSKFLDELSFEKANKINLFNYYQHFIQCCIGLQTAQINGTFVARPYQRSKEDAYVMEEIETLKYSIAALENQAKKETQLTEMVFINTEINKHRSKIEELTNKLSK
ncbi:protein of unknown function [Flavobacterium fontis]|uniref:DUF4391 domain-containing protein n=1 Tax=Flavobacterium fontis TaxID=1124188 RepID=A0A1M5EBG5_9FLAO|nr:DUF4391 domain-containing protein [Flavobacterium fontis]SHF76484.1 protein of unknown function [Flavobacterium fontis]